MTTFIVQIVFSDSLVSVDNGEFQFLSLKLFHVSLLNHDETLSGVNSSLKPLARQNIVQCLEISFSNFITLIYLTYSDYYYFGLNSVAV